MVKKQKHIKKSDDIPHGYNVDTLVMMPVNVHSSFIYWEITKKLLNGKGSKLDAGSLKLQVKIIDTDRKKEICSYQTENRIGKHYVSHPPSCSILIAEIGILKGKRFSRLLTSNPMTTPSIPSQTKTDEIWMEKPHGPQRIIRVTDHDKLKKSDSESSFLADYCREVMGQRENPLSSWILHCFKSQRLKK